MSKILETVKKNYEDLCEMVRGDTPNWTPEETLHRCSEQVDALKFVEEEVDYKEYRAWLIKQREDFEKFEEVQKDSSIFPFYDMWGAMDVDIEFEGMHPDKTIDFNIWEEEGTKFISFYGWDKKNNQVDSSNSLGFYELVEVKF